MSGMSVMLYRKAKVVTNAQSADGVHVTQSAKVRILYREYVNHENCR